MCLVLLEPLPRVLSAITRYEVLQDLKDSGAVVRLSPETGRKHQLRVHCASVLDAPILGDGKYGKRGTPEALRGILGDGPKPLHLHMQRVVLRSWNGQGRDLTIEAPLPPHFSETLRRLGIELRNR